MIVKKHEVLDLSIESVAHNGKGVAKTNDFIILVENTIPGDFVKAELFRKHKNYAEAKVLEFLKYSDHRILSPCSYSAICGGCKWQFLEYQQQLLYKQQFILEALRDFASIEYPQISPTVPSETIFGYRNKMEFSCSDRKWLSFDEISSNVKSWFALGLHVSGTFYKVLDISTCMLQPETGNEILRDAKSFMEKSNQAPYNLRKHYGFWRFLVLRNSVAYNQWMVNIVTASEDINAVRPLAHLITKKYKNVVSILNTVVNERSGVSIRRMRTTNLSGQNTIRERIACYDFDISADSFFQPNTKSTEKLYEFIKLYAGLTGKEFVLDLYCGTGTISAYLSDMAKKIIGIESVKSAVQDAKNNCHLNKITNCKFILGDAKDCLSNIGTVPDVLIVDPPRVGMHQKVVKKILSMSPNKLIYISCNPVSFAKNMFDLKQSYKIENIQPIDMFPHTPHIELIAKLKKTNLYSNA